MVEHVLEALARKTLAKGCAGSPHSSGGFPVNAASPLSRISAALQELTHSIFLDDNASKNQHRLCSAPLAGNSSAMCEHLLDFFCGTRAKEVSVRCRTE